MRSFRIRFVSKDLVLDSTNIILGNIRIILKSNGSNPFSPSIKEEITLNGGIAQRLLRQKNRFRQNVQEIIFIILKTLILILEASKKQDIVRRPLSFKMGDYENWYIRHTLLLKHAVWRFESFISHNKYSNCEISKYIGWHSVGTGIRNALKMRCPLWD